METEMVVLLGPGYVYVAGSVVLHECVEYGWTPEVS